MGFVSAVVDVVAPGVRRVIIQIRDWVDVDAALGEEPPAVVARLTYELTANSEGEIDWPVTLTYEVDYDDHVPRRVELIEVHEPIDPNDLMDELYEIGGTPGNDEDALFDAFLMVAAMDSEGLCDGAFYLPPELAEAIERMDRDEARDVLGLLHP